MIYSKVWCCAEARPESELPACWRNNVSGQCELCNRAIMWRPHADADSTKLCMDCTKLVAKAMEHDDGQPVIRVTEEGMSEFTAMYGEAVANKAISDAKEWLLGEDD